MVFRIIFFPLFAKGLYSLVKRGEVINKRRLLNAILNHSLDTCFVFYSEIIMNHRLYNE